MEHDIEFIDNQTVQQKPYWVSYRQNDILKQEIEEMLKTAITELGKSDFTLLMILVEVPDKDH